MLLESYDRFNDLVEFDPVSGHFLIHSKAERPDLAARPIQGAYGLLDSHDVFFYRKDKALHLRIDDMDVKLIDEVRAELERGDRNVLIILSGDRPVLRVEYQARDDDINRWRRYLNPFIEEEHLDMGLYVYETLRDAKRRFAAYQEA